MDKPELNQYQPDFVSHPGATLKDALDEIGLTQSELATRMGRPVKTISEIINGKASLTPETAMQLELVLGISANFWNTREKTYRQFLTLKKRESEWKTLYDWSRQFPLNDLYKHGYLPKVKEPTDQVKYVLQFLGVNSPDQWATVFDRSTVAFRKSSSFEANEFALGAWLRAGKIEARKTTLNPFDKRRFLSVLRSVRSLTTALPEIFLPKLKRLCSESGVAVVFVPQFKQSGVSGASRWLTPTTGLIQLSLRYKTNDHLWFTFFHEAAHLLLHGKKLIFLDSLKSEGTAEDEANAWASEFLIPMKEYQQFVGGDDLSRATITEFANRLNIAPGIVVGRLQHDKYLRYSHFNDLKIRFTWAKK